MSIPVPRAPKTRFAAPARPVPAPEEVSAGGLIIDFDRPEELPAAIIARINRTGQREWCLPKGHIERGETPRLSFANEQHIARSASEYITTHL